MAISGQTQPSIMNTIGQADLDEKRRQYQIKMQRRVMMAKSSQSMYMQVADYSGPPYCENCKQDMTKVVISPGYPNSGRFVWMCQKCNDWEVVE
jgi:hypothetical protein